MDGWREGRREVYLRSRVQLNLSLIDMDGWFWKLMDLSRFFWFFAFLVRWCLGVEFRVVTN